MFTGITFGGHLHERFALLKSYFACVKIKALSFSYLKNNYFYFNRSRNNRFYSFECKNKLFYFIHYNYSYPNYLLNTPGCKDKAPATNSIQTYPNPHRPSTISIRGPQKLMEIIFFTIFNSKMNYTINGKHKTPLFNDGN